MTPHPTSHTPHKPTKTQFALWIAAMFVQTTAERCVRIFPAFCLGLTALFLAVSRGITSLVPLFVTLSVAVAVLVLLPHTFTAITAGLVLIRAALDVHTARKYARGELRLGE